MEKKTQRVLVSEVPVNLIESRNKIKNEECVIGLKY